MNNKPLIQKILQFPLTKIILSTVAIAIVFNITNLITDSLLENSGLSKEINEFISTITVCVVAVITYILFFKFYDKRAVTELELPALPKGMIMGLGIGLLLQSSTILVMYLLGGYEVGTINPITFINDELSMAIFAGVIEELLFRGIIFKNIEEKLGSYITLGLTALVFGLLHSGNPNATIMSGLIIGIEAGILLGAAYMYTRSLWLAIGIHIAWNFAQSGIFGANTSGHASTKSIITPNISGAEWLTGGGLGPEGSLQAVVFCVIAAVILLYKCHKEGKIMQPYWKKS